ncbi:MAG: RNA 2',3'-cyclic phosphodiesterase [Bacteroidales bacterium]|nr:RNA 2',3'-cyclic phosphodiesterase [Bacteroidales bacterium]HOY39378.1 RNA 2',3'-cyclic phosphodiesterase [Bacteroidales bacterium]
MESKRLFLAIEADDDIAAIAEEIKAANSHLAGLRWAKTGDLHVTLCFLGETPEEKIPEVKDKITRLHKHFMPLELKNPVFCKVSGNRGSGMLWLKFDNCNCFARMVMHSYRSLLNAKPDHTPTPHVTLARFKNDILSIDMLNREYKYSKIFTGIALFESVLTPHGTEYILLEKFGFNNRVLGNNKF